MSFLALNQLLENNETSLRFAATLVLFFLAPSLAVNTQVSLYAAGCVLHGTFMLYDLFTAYKNSAQNINKTNIRHGFVTLLLDVIQFLFSFGLTCTLFACSLMASGALSSRVIPTVQSYYHWYVHNLYHSASPYFLILLRRNNSEGGLFNKLSDDMSKPMCGAWLGFAFCVQLLFPQNSIFLSVLSVPFIVASIFYVLSIVHDALNTMKNRQDTGLSEKILVMASNTLSLCAWLYLLQVNVGLLIPIAPSIPAFFASRPLLQSLFIQQFTSPELSVQIVCRSFAVGMTELIRDQTARSTAGICHDDTTTPVKVLADFLNGKYGTQVSSRL
jgi:hypothetical protein